MASPPPSNPPSLPSKHRFSILVTMCPELPCTHTLYVFYFSSSVFGGVPDHVARPVDYVSNLGEEKPSSVYEHNDGGRDDEDFINKAERLDEEDFLPRVHEEVDSFSRVSGPGTGMKVDMGKCCTCDKSVLSTSSCRRDTRRQCTCCQIGCLGALCRPFLFVTENVQVFLFRFFDKKYGPLFVL